MPMFTRSRAQPVVASHHGTRSHVGSTRSHATTARKPGLLARLTARKPRTTTTTTRRAPMMGSRRRAAPVHHQRKPSMGDKLTGAMMRLKGKLTGRSGVTGAGTKRMRGTDGRGARMTKRQRRPLI